MRSHRACRQHGLMPAGSCAARARAEIPTPSLGATARFMAYLALRPRPTGAEGWIEIERLLRLGEPGYPVGVLN